MHNLMTVKETAEYLRIPLPTVYYLVQRGQLPAIQIGGRWRVKKDALDRDVLHEEEHGQPTVLVVDDDEASRDLLVRFLRREGFAVRTAPHGAAALPLVRELRPAAVLAVRSSLPIAARAAS